MSFCTEIYTSACSNLGVHPLPSFITKLQTIHLPTFSSAETQHTLTDKDLVAIATAISVNHTIKVLDLSQLGPSCLTTDAFYSLSQSLSRNTSLTTLSIAGNNLTDDYAKYIGNLLMRNTTLRKLDIHSNRLGASTGRLMCDALSIANRPGLTCLNFADNPMNQHTSLGPLVRKMATSNTRIRALSCNLAEDSLIELLAPLAMGQNSTISSLKAGHAKLNPRGVDALCRCLSGNQTLTALDLTYAYLNEQGGVQLAHVLANNLSLISLDISHNALHDHGGIAIASALKQNITLTSLAMRSNDLGDMFALSLAKALDVNRVITEVDLSSNPISQSGCDALLRAVNKNPFICSLGNADSWHVPVENRENLLRYLNENQMCDQEARRVGASYKHRYPQFDETLALKEKIAQLMDIVERTNFSLVKSMCEVNLLREGRTRALAEKAQSLNRIMSSAKVGKGGKGHKSRSRSRGRAGGGRSSSPRRGKGRGGKRRAAPQPDPSDDAQSRDSASIRREQAHLQQQRQLSQTLQSPHTGHLHLLIPQQPAPGAVALPEGGGGGGGGGGAGAGAVPPADDHPHPPTVSTGPSTYVSSVRSSRSSLEKVKAAPAVAVAGKPKSRPSSAGSKRSTSTKDTATATATGKIVYDARGHRTVQEPPPPDPSLDGFDMNQLNLISTSVVEGETLADPMELLSAPHDSDAEGFPPHKHGARAGPGLSTTHDDCASVTSELSLPKPSSPSFELAPSYPGSTRVSFSVPESPAMTERSTAPAPPVPLPPLQQTSSFPTLLPPRAAPSVTIPANLPTHPPSPPNVPPVREASLPHTTSRGIIVPMLGILNPP